MMSYSLETIVAWAKRRWFVYPGSDIYWGLANSWDLWPYWVEIRKNILDLWWKTFVQERSDIIWLDAAILMNPKVWEASWHVWWFSDPLIDCKKCHSRIRADKIIDEYIYKNNIKLEEIKEKFWVESLVPESWSFEIQRKFFDVYSIKCPNCKWQDWTDIKKFNLMFKTFQWVNEDTANVVYLRPETAQWIFVNFKNIVDTMRVRVPFGIAQVGKAFRNEITPWNFLFRLREFEQMEIEFFIEPWTSSEWMEYWKNESYKRWIDLLWIKKENIRLRDHEKDELSHYSQWTTDIEYEFPWWWWELQAAWAARTDFDLRQHMTHSWKDMQYSDPKTWKRFVPHVIEPSFGLTRSILTVMLDAYDEETYTWKNWEQETRIVARFHKNVAPIKFAILPLMEKDENMVNKAKEIYNSLKKSYMCEIDFGWNIWKRYRRQDEIWTPYCITVDHQTLQDNTVTIRDRDTMKQSRVKIEEIQF